MTHLKTINQHERDTNIVFYEVGHKYKIITDPLSRYQSVTTWCHSHFPKFDADKIINGMMRKPDWQPGHKYWGLTKQEIKNKWFNNGSSVSSAGTDLHERIELFLNNAECVTHNDLLVRYETTLLLMKDMIEDKGWDNEVEEWKYFINFVRDNPTLKPYRTEWMIYDEDVKLAGSIDMVYENEDGTLSIYDWKRCKSINRINMYNKFALTPCISELHDTNFWHYTLQLNTYKHILERKYGKQVTNLYLVQLHPEVEENNYVILPVPILTEQMNELFEMIKVIHV
jgi:ATP-dependent exoDNAse (exonuclease V) beta subunit